MAQGLFCSYTDLHAVETHVSLQSEAVRRGNSRTDPQMRELRKSILVRMVAEKGQGATGQRELRLVSNAGRWGDRELETRTRFPEAQG